MASAMTDIKDRKKAQALCAGQNRILERIAAGAPIAATLEDIVLLIETSCPGIRCSVLLLDGDGIHVSTAVGPNLAASYKAGVIGHAIGPEAGSCGAAMYYKLPIVVKDVYSDPLWKNYREFAAAHAVQACWSTPILTPHGKALGAFAMHYSDSRTPNVAEQRLADVATRLASIAIQRGLAEESLRESEERLRLVALSTRDGLYDWDIRHDMFLPNESFKALYSPDVLETLNYEWWRSRIDGQDVHRVTSGIERAFQDQRRFWSDEYSFRRSDGTYAAVLDRGYILYDSTGKAIRMIGAMTDITAHRESENALRASEERYRDVVDTQTELICRWLPDTTLTFVNEAYCRHFGSTRNELIGKRFIELVPENDQPRLQELLNSVLDGRQSGAIEHATIQPDASIRYTLWYNHILRNAKGEVEVQGIGRDITEQKRAQHALRRTQEDLKKSHAQIRELAGSLMKAQEQERRHIARELHDDVSQSLAALSISLSDLKRNLPSSAAALLDQVGQIQQHAKRIGLDIRNISHELHPAALKHSGLIVALSSFVREFSSSEEIQCDFCAPECPLPVPEDVAICIYRIVQESLRNVTKHSGSHHAKVELSFYEGCINVLISDEGCGFEVESAREKGGLGLISMAERVQQFQGVFELRSKPGNGTYVRVTVPLNRE